MGKNAKEYLDKSSFQSCIPISTLVTLVEKKFFKGGYSNVIPKLNLDLVKGQH